MDWSYSTSRVFRQCPRKWFFQKVVSDGRSKDNFQREANYLKKLQSVWAWRGSLVDKVVSEYAVPRMNQKKVVDGNDLVSYALRIS